MTENPSAFTETITFLYTQKMDATVHFYEHVLGLDLAVDQGDCRIYRVGSNGFVGFCQRATGSEQPGRLILTLVTEDVDAWAAHLGAHGVELERQPALQPQYRIYNCFLRDPNGYLLEIQRFLDPDWSQKTRPAD